MPVDVGTARAAPSPTLRLLPQFDPRNYGFARLSDLVEASAIAEMERVGDKQKRAVVRLKGGDGG